jgi:hypothetical protein
MKEGLFTVMAESFQENIDVIVAVIFAGWLHRMGY